MARRRKEWFDAKGPCVQCGSWQELELDHIDPKTKVSSRIWSWTQSKRDAELKKCQVLCRSCHLEKTKKDLSERFKDIPQSEARTISDEKFIKVLELIELGHSEHDACKIVGMARGTFSSCKIRGLRKDIFQGA